MRRPSPLIPFQSLFQLLICDSASLLPSSRFSVGSFLSSLFSEFLSPSKSLVIPRTKKASTQPKHLMKMCESCRMYTVSLVEQLSGRPNALGLSPNARRSRVSVFLSSVGSKDQGDFYFRHRSRGCGRMRVFVDVEFSSVCSVFSITE